jgi:endonuclease-3
MAGVTALRRKVARIDQILEAAYGPSRPRARGDAVSTLVRTILSQNTSDTNSGRAFARLRARFPTWADVRDAPVDAVIEAIRPAGLGALKAPRIQAVLRRITSERGALSLDFLRRWPVDRAKAWLRSLDGVGPKTAAIVLVFGLGKPAFPVDTHVYRVGGRLGIIPQRISVEDAHEWMEALVRPERYGPFHLLLVRHGREICKAGRPRCEICPVRRLCDFYARTQGYRSPPGPRRGRAKNTARAMFRPRLASALTGARTKETKYREGPQA